MKKLVLTFAAIGLFVTGAQAQETETTTTTEVTTQTVVSENNGYNKIEVVELPLAVTTAITRDFSAATTQQAWVREKDGKVIYKLKLDVNGEKMLFADAEGNWIDKKDKKGDDDENKDS